MNTWTKLKYGFVIASSLTATGVVMYLTPTKYVKSVDMVELALGCQERCFATQQTTNPAMLMVTQTLVHSRNTWTNTPYPWYEYGTNGTRTTNYLKASSYCYYVTNSYLREWWHDPNSAGFLTAPFSVMPISYGLYFPSNTGERMLWSGYTNVSITGVGGTYNPDGDYFLVGRYRYNVDPLWGQALTLERECSTNAPVYVLVTSAKPVGTTVDLWICPTNFRDSFFLDYGMREGRPYIDISNGDTYQEGFDNASMIFGVDYSEYLFPVDLWATADFPIEFYSYNTWGLDSIFYSPVHVAQPSTNLIPTIVRGNVNPDFIRSAPIYEMYYVPSNPISKYINGDELYKQIAEKTYWLIQGSNVSEYLRADIAEPDGTFTGCYQNVTSAESPNGFPRETEAQLFSRLGITNYFVDVMTNGGAFVVSNMVSSNGWNMKHDILKELKYTEKDAYQVKCVTKCWQGFSTNSWENAKTVSQTNFTISTNVAYVDADYSTVANFGYKAKDGRKYTLGYMLTPNTWYAVAMSEEVTLVTYCNTNVGRTIYWYHACTTPANTTNIFFGGTSNVYTNAVFDANGEQIVQGFEWYYESKSASNIYDNIVTNVFGDNNIGNWCAEPTYMSNSVDGFTWNGYHKPYSIAIAKWNFQYCTNN